MNNGWISIHRKMLEWEWYDDANTFRLFIHLLLKANHAPQKWRGNTVNSGQLITGRISLSEELGLSQQQIRTSLNKLKSTNEITIKTTNKYSILTIVNYNNYQNSKKESTSKTTSNLTNKQPTSNQQVTTNNNTNNNNNVNKGQKQAQKTIPKKHFPAELNKKAWLEYIDYRKKAKIRKLTDAGEDKQIKKLISFGDYDTQALSINETIANGWQGIFEPKQKNKQSRGHHDGFSKTDYKSGAVTPKWAGEKS